MLSSGAVDRGMTWGFHETKTLLTVWGSPQIQTCLGGTYRNSAIYEQVAQQLGTLGYERTGKQCRAKIKAMKIDYNKAKMVCDEVERQKRCRFFAELDEVLGRTRNNIPVTSSNRMALHDESSSDSELLDLRRQTSLPALNGIAAVSQPATADTDVGPRKTPSGLGERNHSGRFKSFAVGSQDCDKPSTPLETWETLSGLIHSADAKSIPIHCVIEQAPPTATPSDETNVELDTYAIVPGSTLLTEIVRTALVKLGYNTTEALGAKGAIQIKNWKPLSFDTITDNPDATVEDILCDLTSIATLRIRLCSRTRINAVDEIKEKLLQFLLQTSEGALSGCPIDKPTLTQLSLGQLPETPVPETRDAFNKWYQEKTPIASAHRPRPPKPDDMDTSSLHSSLGHSPDLPHSNNNNVKDLTANLAFSRSRIRTSFDPEHEIPRLHHWFQQHQHPSREQMVAYLNELNALESRKGRKPLDLTNIVYWFKNARAAQRRMTLAAKGGETSSSTPMSVDTSVGDLDESIDEHLSPCPPEQVPVLPNKNAVYMISDPMHHSIAKSDEVESTESKEASVASPDPSVKSEPNSVLCIMPQDAEQQQEEPEDLTTPKQDRLSPPRPVEDHVANRCSSVESQRSSLDDSSRLGSSAGSGEARLFLKREREEDNGYGSRNATPSPKHLHFTPPQHVHPSAFNMSMPLNMHYMHHPAAALFMDTSPILSSQFKDSLSSEDRKKRSRVFIDPLSEIPKLEKWFIEDTHPSSYMIEKYTEELNRAEYRQRFPKLEPKNVQLWFKNHRAKVKRARIEGPNSTLMSESYSPQSKARIEGPNSTISTM